MGNIGGRTGQQDLRRFETGYNSPNPQTAAIREGEVEDHLESFIPKPGNSVLITAGTVHALGGDVVIFEIQQNSDVTFRLYDWNHIE